MNRREFVAMAPAFPVAAMSASLVLREDGKETLVLDVSVLKLQAGDSLVLTAPGNISMETAERIKAYVEHFIPTVKAIVMGDGLKIEGVLRGPA